MPTTRGYPFPTGTDPADVPADIQALAEVVDTDVADVETDAAAALATHAADATDVHGIADTAALYRAGGTDVAVVDGGTGASTAAGARANLAAAPLASPAFTGTVTLDGDAIANIYRDGAGAVRTDGDFRAGGNMSAKRGAAPQVLVGAYGPGGEAGIQLGSAQDTNFYRSAANTAKTDDSLHVGADFRHLGANLGFFGAAAAPKPTVAEWSSTDDVLASLLSGLTDLGLISWSPP